MVDFAIIGGGLAGSIVKKLIKDEGTVLLIDNKSYERPLHFIHSCLLRYPEDIESSLRSLEIYKNLGIKISKFQTFTFFNNEEKAKLYLNLWKTHGIGVEEIREPREFGFHGDGFLIPYYGDGLIRKSEIYEKEDIVGNAIINQNSIIVNNYVIKANNIILSAGYKNELLANQIGFKLPSKLYYCYGLIFISDPLLDKIIIYDYVYDYYSRPLTGFGLPLSFGGNGGELYEDERFILQEYIISISQGILKRIGKQARALKLVKGICDISLDSKPFFGKIADNIYVIGGLNGYGAEVGPAIAECLVNQMIGKKLMTYCNEYEISRFNYYNFSGKIKEPHEL
jgi:hypothetical protein